MYYVYMRIETQRVRDDARRILRAMIVEGELAPDMHVEEVKISAQIGASRTPVREALIALEEEGLVRSAPRKGFVVVAPDEALVREIYPVLTALEAMAVRMGGAALCAAAPKLAEINGALKREKRKARQYALDRAFHVELCAHYVNARLQRLLAQERARAELVDGAGKRGMANHEGSCGEHDEIIEALRRGATDAAAEALTRHWEGGTEVVALWLREDR